MYSRLSPLAVLQQAKDIVESIGGNSQAKASAAKNIASLMLVFRINELGELEEASIKTADAIVKQIRENLSNLLGTFSYPSPQYNAIHNVLLLLAQYFPFGVDNSKFICCITNEEIQADTSRFVLASGHHFSEDGILSMYTSGNYSRNPINREPITERDRDRIQLFFFQRNPNQRLLETHSLDYAAGGAMAGFFCIAMPIMGVAAFSFVAIFLFTVLGIISFPAFVTAALHSSLLVPIALTIEYGPVIVGAFIGAIIGAFPTAPQLESLKQKVGDVSDNLPLQKLASKQKGSDVKELKQSSHPQIKSRDDLFLFPRLSKPTTELKISRSPDIMFARSKSCSDISSISSSPATHRDSKAHPIQKFRI